MTKNIPVIIVSATHGWHTSHEKHCGADDRLNKPFDITDLISRVKYYTAWTLPQLNGEQPTNPVR